MADAPAAEPLAPVVTTTATSPAATITTPVPVVNADTPASVTTEGVANGLPPQAPGIQLEPPEEVKALREWEHRYVKNSIHSRDTDHYNVIHQHVEAICAKLHAKYPVEG